MTDTSDMSTFELTAEQVAQGWVRHDGGERPVCLSYYERVEAMFRNGTLKGALSDASWSHPWRKGGDAAFDVVAYRIVQPEKPATVDDDVDIATLTRERDEARAEVAKLRAEVERLAEECRASDCVNDMLMRKETKPVSVPYKSAMAPGYPSPVCSVCGAAWKHGHRCASDAPSTGALLLFRPENDYIGRLGGDDKR